MFNLARQRYGEIPEAFKQEDMLFRSKPREQNLVEDINGLKRIMVEHGLENPADALSMVGDVGHWQYLQRFRPKYLKDVFRKVIHPAEQLAEEFEQHPEKFPLPQPPQGGQGQGGGMPPAGAASAKRVKFASFVMPDGEILIKEENDYMLHSDGEVIEFYTEAGVSAAMQIAIIRLAAKGKSPVVRR